MSAQSLENGSSNLKQSLLDKNNKSNDFSQYKKDSTLDEHYDCYNPYPLSWLADILELGKGVIIWVALKGRWV